MNHPSSPLRTIAIAGQDQQVNHLGAGLCSIEGANTVISIICDRKSVHRLILGHSELGDKGCRWLFNFLSSEEGSEYNIQEINLNANIIGDDGLPVTSEYLKGNQYDRKLFHQNNSLRGIPKVISVFVQAINSSCLEILSLFANKYLCDTFFIQFLPSLNAIHLRELHLSSRKLHVLECNGNSLGLRGIKSIICVIHNSNYTLKSVGLHDNQLLCRDTSSETSSDEEGSQGAMFIHGEAM